MSLLVATFIKKYEEFSNWKSQIVISNQEKMGLRKPPYAFTEQGVAMLSAVLRSETAIKVSIQIMKAFIQLKKFVFDNTGLFHRIDKIEAKQLETDEKFEQLFRKNCTILAPRLKTLAKSGLPFQGWTTLQPKY